MRCDGPPSTRMNVAPLTNRTKAGRNGLRGRIPPQPPVHGDVTVIAPLVTLRTLGIWQIVAMMIEEKVDARTVDSVGAPRGIEDRISIEVCQVRDRPANCAIRVCALIQPFQNPVRPNALYSRSEQDEAV